MVKRFEPARPAVARRTGPTRRARFVPEAQLASTGG
jgi:hypothetical protein